MKKVVILLIVLVCLSCKEGEKPANFPKFPPEDTVKLEFDFDAFNKHRRLWMDKYGEHKMPWNCEYLNAEWRYVTQDSSKTGYLQRVFRGVYGDIYSFYPSGKLRSRGFFFTNDGRSRLFDVGNVYYFDKHGQLDSVGNYDINYKFNTDSIIAFFQARGLKVWDKWVKIERGEEMKSEMFDDGSGYPYAVGVGTGKYRWNLEYMLPGSKELRGVDLDAETGAILKDSLLGTLNE